MSGDRNVPKEVFNGQLGHLSSRPTQGRRLKSRRRPSRSNSEILTAFMTLMRRVSISLASDASTWTNTTCLNVEGRLIRKWGNSSVGLRLISNYSSSSKHGRGPTLRVRSREWRHVRRVNYPHG